MVVLIVLAAVAGIAAGAVWLWWRTSQDVAHEVELFARARATTSRWAADPSSSPAPVLDIADRGGAPVVEQPKRATRGR
jgi:hypothetical protein